MKCEVKEHVQILPRSWFIAKQKTKKKQWRDAGYVANSLITISNENQILQFEILQQTIVQCYKYTSNNRYTYIGKKVVYVYYATHTYLLNQKYLVLMQGIH